MSDKGKSTRMVLEEVSEDKFPELVEAIKAYLPASFNVQSMVTTHLKYSHLDKIGARVYTPNHAAYRYKMVVITPVATAPRFQSLSLFWSEKDVSEEEVTVLLRSLPEFKWDLPVLVRPVAADLEDEMNRIVFKLSEGVLVKAYPLDLLVYVHDGPLPPVPKLPDHYYVEDISACHAQQIHSSWPFIYVETAEGLSNVIEVLPAVGVFRKRTEKDIDSKKSSENDIDTENSSEKDINTKNSSEKDIDTKNSSEKDIETKNSSEKNIDTKNSPEKDIDTKNSSEKDIDTKSSSEKDIDTKNSSEKNKDTKNSSEKDIDTKNSSEKNKDTKNSSENNGQSSCSSITENPNASVRNLQQNVPSKGGALVSWTLLKHGGDIGMTYTEDLHRRKGLANIATTTLAHRLRSQKHKIVACIVKGSAASIHLHTKMGFTFHTAETVMFYFAASDPFDQLPYIVPKLLQG